MARAKVNVWGSYRRPTQQGACITKAPRAHHAGRVSNRFQNGNSSTRLHSPLDLSDDIGTQLAHPKVYA